MFPCVSCSPPPKVRDPISDGDGDTQFAFFPSGKHSIHELHDAPSLSIRRDFMHVVGYYYPERVRIPPMCASSHRRTALHLHFPAGICDTVEIEIFIYTDARRIEKVIPEE